MASTSSRILSVVRRRPLASLSLATATGAFGYASLVEFRANREERLYQEFQQRYSLDASDRPAPPAPPTLPRTYSWDALNSYWSLRPVSTLARLLEITTELSPLVLKYMWDFKVMSKKNQDEVVREHAQQWRHALTNLGPAFVKAGQQLAIRPDLVAPAVLEELQKLCDSVRPVADEVAMAVLREELGDRAPEDLFDNLHLVASASLGQVYKANLKEDGTEVAVKIQRPGMTESFSLDLFLLQSWGVFMDAWTSVITHQKPYHKKFLENFAKGGYGELDYELEARNQHHFRDEMKARSCPVVIPRVYDDYTSRRVLTTQWMDGIRLSDAEPDIIRKLIPVGVELFLCQLLDIGAFHAGMISGSFVGYVHLVRPTVSFMC